MNQKESKWVVSSPQLFMDNHANDILHKNLQLVAILCTLRGRESVLSVSSSTTCPGIFKFCRIHQSRTQIYRTQSKGTGIKFSSKMPIVSSTIINDLSIIIFRIQ